MSRIYLCLGCGHTMGRSLGSCIVCRTKTINCYNDPQSPELLAHLKRFGKLKNSTAPMQSYMLVVASMAVFLFGGAFIMRAIQDKGGPLAAVQAFLPKQLQEQLQLTPAATPGAAPSSELATTPNAVH